MWTRNGLILVTLGLGNFCLLMAVREDRQAWWVVAASTSYLSAWVYAALTRPRL